MVKAGLFVFCTLVNTSYFGGFNSLLSGRRRNEGGNKKHYDISKLEAAEEKSPRFNPQAEILGINLPTINHCDMTMLVLIKLPKKKSFIDFFDPTCWVLGLVQCQGWARCIWKSLGVTFGPEIENICENYTF